MTPNFLTETRCYLTTQNQLNQTYTERPDYLLYSIRPRTVHEGEYVVSLDQPASINSRFSSVDESGPVSYASWRRPGDGNRKLLRCVISPSQRRRQLLERVCLNALLDWLSATHLVNMQVAARAWSWPSRTKAFSVKHGYRQAVVSIFVWFIGGQSL